MAYSWVSREWLKGNSEVIVVLERYQPRHFRYGETLPSLTVGDRRDGVVKLLSERRDVSHNICSKSSQTPVTMPAKNGHDRVVEVLQARYSQLLVIGFPLGSPWFMILPHGNRRLLV